MNDIVDLVIVGGGLSGILAALKLSSKEKRNNKIVLIEEQPTLGGRLFFASPRSFLGKNRIQIQEELLCDAHEDKLLSGFGFEMYDLQTKESLFRHLQNSLTSEENKELDHYLLKFEDKNLSLLENNCYFVKKEFTSLSLLLNGSSEILTKKEAEYLKSIAFTPYDEENSLFKKGWQELSKQAKESLGLVFTSIVGPSWESLTFKECCESLNQFFCAKQNNYFLPFQRKVAIEIFLEKILINRGVEIKNLCKLLRVEQTKDKIFSLALQDEVEPDKNSLTTKNIILSLPLAKCAGLLPKEMLLPEQSKFISKIGPTSLVVYELSHFTNLKSSEVNLKINAYDNFLFPVERVKAFYTADDRILFYTELDYESSLQAQSVREAVARLKRAASRVLNEEILKEMKKGFRMPQNHFGERVILLSVAHSVPSRAKINFELKQVSMGAKHLYCCGDSFFTLANEPWKRIIHSVNDIAHQFI